MRCAVIVFPGSNCDRDMYYALRDGLDVEVEMIPYSATSLDGFDAIFLPGGFSYGDYLRAGAIARFAPVMQAVKKAADEGRWVVGVCNGFQVLLEAGLLPGAMKRNAGLNFVCRDVALTVANATSAFSSDYVEGQQIILPVAHGEGNYECDEETLAQLEANAQVIFRYAEPVNGSRHDIAGIINAHGNVLGMMPHPERAVEALLGSTDGLALFTSLKRHITSSQRQGS